MSNSLIKNIDVDLSARFRYRGDIYSCQSFAGSGIKCKSCDLDNLEGCDGCNHLACHSYDREDKKEVIFIKVKPNNK